LYKGVLPVAHVTGLVLFLLALAVHEVGHAIAMMRRGVEIKEAGLGFPVTGRFKLTFRPKFLPFPITVCPVFIGAYVQPTEKGEEQLDQMSYQDQASCYAAGVIVNLVFGCILLSIGSALAVVQPGYAHRHALIILAASVVLGALAAIFRRILSRIMPFLGLVVTGVIVYQLILSVNNVGGPGATITWARSTSRYHSDTFIRAAAGILPGFRQHSTPRLCIGTTMPHHRTPGNTPNITFS
jgi:hypothetical protein